MLLLVTSIGAGQDPNDEWAGAVVSLQAGVQDLADTPFLGWVMTTLRAAITNTICLPTKRE
ncbi:MAG: hypothetical protein HY253_03285 [Burkholderiales bacterium]|nr:hypothetical protein [Burkholderiales bacterium]